MSESKSQVWWCVKSVCGLFLLETAHKDKEGCLRKYVATHIFRRAEHLRPLRVRELSLLKGDKIVRIRVTEIPEGGRR